MTSGIIGSAGFFFPAKEKETKIKTLTTVITTRRFDMVNLGGCDFTRCNNDPLR